MFTRTIAINKLLKLKKRVKVVPGGTSAGKTYGIIPILIDRATKTPNLTISIVSESIPHLRRGAMKDFINIMKDTGRWHENRFNKTNLVYTFVNGSYVEFFSTDQPDRLRGARRHILFINEANNITWEAYQQMAIRTSIEIWLDFNPSNEFWAHEELTNDPDVEWLTLTYKDNNVLEPSLVREIEKGLFKAFHNPYAADLFHKDNIKNGYWANWWKVYGLGQLGVLQGTIFTNWSIIDTIPDVAEYMGLGLDFGYTTDPTAAIDLYMYNNQPIYDEVIFQKGLLNGDIARKLKMAGKTDEDFIYADCAEPKSIDEINTYGFSILPVEKGPDSIKFGIGIMQESPFFVTKRSVNMISELRKYAWDQDKTGKQLNRPIDMYNHAIDGARYISMMRIANRNYSDPSPSADAYKQALELFK
jgi:phage terminase large subunit